MNICPALRSAILGVNLLLATAAFGRGGETGTLDEEPEARVASSFVNINRMPNRTWSPHYMAHEHFRRLRARLSLQPLAPIPGWDSRRAFRSETRYFTEDGVYELLPIVPDSVR